MHLDDVARGAGIGRHDRRLAPRQPIEQGRFAGIGRPGNGDHEAVAQPLAAAAIGQDASDLVTQLLRSMKRGTEQIFGHIGFIGKIDPRLDQGQRLDQSPPPSLGAVADQTFELTKGEAPLRLRFGGDEIGQALDRREIEPAVFEGAAGELASLGGPATLDRRQRIEHTGNDRLAAMKLQLGDVLAGLAARRRKPQRQRFVDDLTARRIAHPRQRRLARLGQAPDQFLKRNTGARPGDAHHSNRRRRPAGGQREDGGTIRHNALLKAIGGSVLSLPEG